jgi:hypothetical protein
MIFFPAIGCPGLVDDAEQFDGRAKGTAGNTPP